ncbi:serine hydrolase domain-containing protein [Paenibacillus ginsengarvi]|nr:serine hydrolase [Paenibacillus ginsengarvi]
MASADLSDTFGNFTNRGVHSVVIVRNGYLVAEAYQGQANADTPQDIRSVTKSILSLLTGIVLAEHNISLEQKIIDFFPYIANDPLKSEIRIKHLLTMTSGLEWNNKDEQSSVDMMYSQNWVQYILDCPSVFKPGTRFRYSNGDAHLLSVILQKVTNSTMLDYASVNLFSPLGITNVKWDHDPQGHNIGAWAMAMTARDMARIGYLLLMEGEWEGRQLLSRDWIRDSMTGRVELEGHDGRTQKYGLFWWQKWLLPGLMKHDTRQHSMFYAAGSGGSRIFVIPGLQLIVALTAQTTDGTVPEQLLNSIVRAIKADRPLTVKREDTMNLARAIESFRG